MPLSKTIFGIGSQRVLLSGKDRVRFSFQFRVMAITPVPKYPKSIKVYILLKVYTASLELLSHDQLKPRHQSLSSFLSHWFPKDTSWRRRVPKAF